MKPQTKYNQQNTIMYGLRLNKKTDNLMIQQIEYLRNTGRSYQDIFKEALKLYLSQIVPLEKLRDQLTEFAFNDLINKE